MNQKIKKISIIIFYILIWLVFIYSSLGVISGLFYMEEIDSIEDWKTFSLFIILPFISAYLLRHHFKFLAFSLKRFSRWAWQKENLHKLAIIIIAISILIIAISFIT